MKPSIILYKALSDDLLHRLEERFTVARVPNLRPEIVAQHVDAFTNAEDLLGSSETVNTALLEKTPRLCTASTISVDYDNFNVGALDARKVLLIHTPTVLAETVADTIMALVLSIARRVVRVVRRVRVGEWARSTGPDWSGTDVRHKALGIIGMSHVGLALAQRAHFGFSMSALYNTRRHYQEAEEHFNARYYGLDTLLQESGFVCLIPPLADETHHLFSTEQFAKMKSSAIFINAGCGPMVNEKALTAALQKGETHAAGLDAFEQEPLSVDSPLLSLPNAVTVPRIGSATYEARYNMTACAVGGLIDTLQGRIEKNYINPQVAS